MLVDEGKLSLDQPLAEIIPAFANMQVQKQYDGSIGPDNLEPAARPILIRNLITHTSGSAIRLSRPGRWRRNAARSASSPAGSAGSPFPVSTAATDRQPGEIRGPAGHLATGLSTGTRWSYSTGLDLTGRVIEVVSGQSFDAFLKERIFDPCGMASTWFQVPQSEVGRLTTNYGVWTAN